MRFFLYLFNPKFFQFGFTDTRKMNFSYTLPTSLTSSRAVWISTQVPTGPTTIAMFFLFVSFTLLFTIWSARVFYEPCLHLLDPAYAHWDKMFGALPFHTVLRVLTSKWGLALAFLQIICGSHSLTYICTGEGLLSGCQSFHQNCNPFLFSIQLQTAKQSHLPFVRVGEISDGQKLSWLWEENIHLMLWQLHT